MLLLRTTNQANETEHSLVDRRIVLLGDRDCRQFEYAPLLRLSGLLYGSCGPKALPCSSNALGEGKLGGPSISKTMLE